jgi:hypothetical protein
LETRLVLLVQQVHIAQLQINHLFHAHLELTPQDLKRTVLAVLMDLFVKEEKPPQIQQAKNAQMDLFVIQEENLKQKDLKFLVQQDTFQALQVKTQDLQLVQSVLLETIVQQDQLQKQLALKAITAQLEPNMQLNSLVQKEHIVLQQVLELLVVVLHVMLDFTALEEQINSHAHLVPTVMQELETHSNHYAQEELILETLMQEQQD